MKKRNLNFSTPICSLFNLKKNEIYIKREDFYPFSFGGNKARKGMLFWKELKKSNANYVVTYGSSSSNHCRVIANIAAAENIPCCIISPEEIACETFNKKLMEKFGAKIIYSKIEDVHQTIEDTLRLLKEKGYNPYFIKGGGHGNIGTEAYIECFDEIREYEQQNNIHFDYIFHASGTGTTQAGLVCGKLLSEDKKEIIGISIARKNPYGAMVVENSVKEYLHDSFTDKTIKESITFIDDYIVEGYGKSNLEVDNIIDKVMKKSGVPLDKTYTGKAFWGMTKYLEKNNIEEKKILFIHTGGTPLFFDDLNK